MGESNQVRSGQVRQVRSVREASKYTGPGQAGVRRQRPQRVTGGIAVITMVTVIPGGGTAYVKVVGVCHGHTACIGREKSKFWRVV